MIAIEPLAGAKGGNPRQSEAIRKLGRRKKPGALSTLTRLP